MFLSTANVMSEEDGMNLHRFSESIGNYTVNTLNFISIENYIDIDVLKWLIWLFTPFVVSYSEFQFC